MAAYKCQTNAGAPAGAADGLDGEAKLPLCPPARQAPVPPPSDKFTLRANLARLAHVASQHALHLIKKKKKRKGKKNKKNKIKSLKDRQIKPGELQRRVVSFFLHSERTM